MRHIKKINQRRVASLIFTFALPVFCYSQVATTTVNTSTTIMPKAPLLLGITYDCRSSLSDVSNTLMGYHNTNGTFNPAVDAVFNNFPMAGLRYPANGILQGFEWKKSIGPIANRIPQQVFAQPSIPAQVMEFGFDEFMAMTAARGVDPKDVQIMVPIYDSAIIYPKQAQTDASIPNVLQSNADWVEYANAPSDGNITNPGGGIDWAEVRAANGHPLPYGIEIWNMGNEPYTFNEYDAANDVNAVNYYISNIVPMIDAMLAIDPTIKISVTVTSRSTNAWTSSILNSALLQGKIYALNCHFFLTEDFQAGTPIANQPNVFVANSRMITLANAAQTKGYKLIIGDQAHAIISTTPTQAEQDIAMQWQGANETADMLLAMSQIQNIERANFWVYGLWTNQWHPIRKNSNGTFTSMPAAELYKILNPAFLDNSVSVTTTSPAASDGISYSVRSSAFISTDLSQLNVVSVNRDKTNTVPLQVNGTAGYNLLNARLLTATALSSDTIIESAVVADGSGNYPLPPMSVLILEYSSIPLPISLINFGLHTLDKKTIKLFWSTATEQNNDYFLVEKSDNAITWEALSKIKANGNSTTTQNYSTIDFNPFVGKTYYRLKQVDLDGKFYYSKILSTVTNNKNDIIIIYPNPASNHISFTEIQNEIEIYNSIGQIVIPKIRNTKNISVEQLLNGIYFIRTDKAIMKFIVKH